jgi:FtsH-binding integral membrane protein
VHSTTTHDYSRETRIDAGLKKYMNNVYGMMSLGTFVTFVTAWYIASTPDLLQVFYVIERPSSPFVLKTFFGVFAAMMGVSLTSVFLVFELGSIANTFLITSATFAGLSLWGYTTKKDLTGLGSLLFMSLFGLIAASIFSLYFQSTLFEFAVNLAGVLIFAGLTAYDTQHIKTEYVNQIHSSCDDEIEKSAVMGALDLYLDFINLFLRILAAAGKRK